MSYASLIDGIHVPSLMAKVAARDPSAGPDLHRLADALHGLADDLERGEAGDATQGMGSPGAMSDRVRMCVVGPDGEIKRSIDTGAQR